jgi:dihydroneopterin aldolase
MDRIVLANQLFLACHGVEAREKVEPQAFAIDVELELDLGPAGRADDLGLTVDYAAVYRTVARIVESTTFDLIEALGEAIAAAILGEQPRVDAVVVRIRKPEVELGGPLDHAAIELTRRRS